MNALVSAGPLGPYSLELGWVPAPRYVLRRHRVLQLMRDLPVGRLLEIGCGSGALLCELESLGHACFGTEHSQRAFELARKINSGCSKVQIFREIEASWQGSLDYILTFEVLEHIEDDLGALRHWNSLLAAGGYLLLSVPAHQRKWNATDVGAGHFRRYEREGLKRVLEDAGFEIRKLEIYGFPLANMLAPVQSLRYRRKLSTAQLDDSAESHARLANTAHSGVDRSIECKVYPYYARQPGLAAMQACCQIQSWFKNSELGNGYLALAQKSR